ncbi:hypothetical protein TrLO_g6632 [Triparma laevis f. longispina]|uniref:protein O-GlcNAc transferase n=1 Tax=Triparma laevis f. longispina TaxID=1714387 RepID=A0A9W7DSG0_9STRA|nr:hypothetical protein TrLO_g6632 [Triparma laevis f. longispina]
MVASKKSSKRGNPVATPETSAESKITMMISSSQKLYAKGDYKDALSMCEAVYVADAYRVDNLLLLGALHFQLRNLSESIFYNQQCIRVDPNFAEAYSNLGNSLKELGDINGAIQFYLKAIKIKPRFPDAYNNLASSQMQLGNTEEAISTFQMALTLNPRLVDAHSNLGNLFKAQGRLEEAKKSYLEAIRIRPDFAIAWSNLAGVFNTMGERQTAIEYYKEAIRLCPEFADAHSNLGNVLKEEGQVTGNSSMVEEALNEYNYAVKLRPDFAIAHGNLASCYYDQGKLDLAVSTFKYAIQLEPNFPDAYNNLGNTYREMGRLEEAINCYRTTLRLKPDHPHAYNNLGNAMKDKGLIKEAIHCYVTAARLMPRFAAAHSNLGSILKEQGKLDQSLAHYQEAINIDPMFADAYANMGNVYKDMYQLTKAIQCYSTAIKMKKDFAEAYANLGSAYRDAGQLLDSITCFQKALDLNGDMPEAFANLVHVLSYTCDWSDRAVNHNKLQQMVAKQMQESTENLVVPCIQPFHALCYNLSPKELKDIATLYADKAKLNVSLLEIPSFHMHHRASGARIRIGYVSSDFGNHPCSHLMQSSFGMHNREQFEVFCYALNQDDRSSWRQKIQDEVEHFKDVSALQAGDLATLIHSDGIHVLINLNGYTKGSKNEVFSLQPSPIQIGLGGYLGTSGADYMQYMVSDHHCVPAQNHENFSEHLILMPHSMVVNDHKQTSRFALEKCEDVSRGQYGLSDDSFVYACFNQGYKITPEVFAIWCGILKEVDNAVLWLLRFPPASEDNLLAEVSKLGIDTSRIIFSDVAPKEEHIKRCQLPDLFLDTEFCGVTTSCDILWSGTPMISKLGENIHNRVGGSLLSSCGLKELVVETWEDYKNLAVKLAMDDRTLLAHRFNLEMARETCELFDTQKWVYNLEHGILQIVHGYEKGHPNKDVVCDFTYKKSRSPSLK